MIKSVNSLFFIEEIFKRKLFMQNSKQGECSSLIERLLPQGGLEDRK